MKMLEELTGKDMKKVNSLILSRIHSDVVMIPEVAKYLVFSGGKRLRPMLTLAAALMFGYRGNQHVELASAIEFIHTATLLHDDVVDESKLRRGKSAARLIWGNQVSVLVGDFLLSQAFRMVIETKLQQALEILSVVACTISEGELLQLSIARSLDVTEEDHLCVIRSKTAILFSAALEIASVIAGADDSVRDALKLYGMNLGIVFQLVDDILDYQGDVLEMGKNVGDDFRNGKVTLPVILAFQRATTEEKDFWNSAIKEDIISTENLEKALVLIKDSNALTDAKYRVHYYGEKAKDSLKNLPENDWKSAFMEVVDFCVGRLN
ncbi:polyprenyl synthetase family protein [Candidatus Liberibacter sp.]|uniref:polyprenyl synthetase family protein n=1 Tax=Candidatus Liberibacter sp. TaxID=34022 RepID=UPI0015F51AA9|nr:polyprenyl synthetase family protein [Candidatus Liberibacter sp.]MBA5723907.1 polyprenyl synthetase family protein [Candidatus Liberibacter sp.]